MLTTLGLLLISALQILGIKVIRTNPNSPLLKNGMAIIQNSSLSAYEQFTICLRIKTFQFDNFYSNKQAILTSGKNYLLWAFVGGGNCGFDGCKDYYKDLIKETPLDTSVFNILSSKSK